MKQLPWDPSTSAAIDAFKADFRRPEFADFEFSKPLDLFPTQSPVLELSPHLTWVDPWPLRDRAGVYLVYSSAYKLLYVGKGQPIGARLSWWFRGGPVCRPRGKWTEQPRFIVTVAVPEIIPFEAPYLEAYLIWTLKPPDNTLGK